MKGLVLLLLLAVLLIVFFLVSRTCTIVCGLPGLGIVVAVVGLLRVWREPVSGHAY